MNIKCRPYLSLVGISPLANTDIIYAPCHRRVFYSEHTQQNCLFTKRLCLCNEIRICATMQQPWYSLLGVWFTRTVMRYTQVRCCSVSFRTRWISSSCSNVYVVKSWLLNWNNVKAFTSICCGKEKDTHQSRINTH